MMVLVIISYLIAGAINLFYGSYRDLFNLFFRTLSYPILEIIIELPNMMVIYYIHWQTYKPSTTPEVILVQDEDPTSSNGDGTSHFHESFTSANSGI